MEELGFVRIELTDSVKDYLYYNNIYCFISEHVESCIYGDFSCSRFYLSVKVNNVLFSKKLFKRTYPPSKSYKTKTTFYDSISNFDEIDGWDWEEIEPDNPLVDLGITYIIDYENDVIKLCSDLMQKLEKLHLLDNYTSLYDDPSMEYI